MNQQYFVSHCASDVSRLDTTDGCPYSTVDDSEPCVRKAGHAGINVVTLWWGLAASTPQVILYIH